MVVNNRKRDFEKIAYKMLNELKYNKRLAINWVEIEESINTYFEEYTESQNTESESILQKISYILCNTHSKLLNEQITVQNFRAKFKPLPLLKKINPEQEETDNPEIISFDNTDSVSNKNIDYNYFIQGDINLFVLSALWCDSVGRIIDDSNNLPQNTIFANRLSDKNTIFKPYFSAFSEFRDNNFNTMKDMIKNDKAGVYVQIDFSKCFYYVNTEHLKGKVEDIIEKYFKNNFPKGVQYKEKNEYKYFNLINSIIFTIIEEYSDILLKEYEIAREDNDESSERCHNIKCLPIGFWPSSVLINLYLKEFDDLIINEFNPVNYGRYVDDIGMVIQKPINKNNKKNIVDEIQDRIQKILCNFNEKNYSKIKLKDSIDSKLSEEEAPSCEHQLSINMEKNLYFIFTEHNDVNYLKKFEKSLERLSSDNYRLFDISNFKQELHRSYIIIKDPTKLDDLFSIERDKKQLSKIISSIFLSTSNSFSNIDTEQNKIICKVFCEHFFNLIDDVFFLELYDYWYQLIFIELVADKKIDDEFSSNWRIQENTFNNTFTIKKIDDLAKRLSDSPLLTEKLAEYKKILESLFLNVEENKSLNEIQDYVRLPKFKIKFLSKMDFLLHYENQLKILWEFINLTSANELVQDHPLDFDQEFLNLLKNKFGNQTFYAAEKLDDSLEHNDNSGGSGNFSSNDNFNDNGISDQNGGFGNGGGSGDSGKSGNNLINYSKKDNKLRLGMANYHKYTDRWDHFLLNSQNKPTLADFIKVFNEGIQENVDLITFPEQGLTFDDLPYISKQVAKNKIAIVGGLDFIIRPSGLSSQDEEISQLKTYNLTLAIIPKKRILAQNNSDVYYTDAQIILLPKIYPSPTEYEQFSNSREYEGAHRRRPIFIPEFDENDRFENIYFDLYDFKHAVVNCYEATDLEIKYEVSQHEPNIIHLITNNRDVSYYEKIAETLSREIMCIVTVNNYSEYGGTLVYSPYKERYMRVIASHKGSINTHLDVSEIDILGPHRKRFNNLDKKYRQNPPRYYYKNISESGRS